MVEQDFSSLNKRNSLTELGSERAPSGSKPISKASESSRPALDSGRSRAGSGRKSASSSDSEPVQQSSPGTRLQKVLASAGLGSRRKCEELILSGRVEVDGRVVSELGVRVDPFRQEIRVDGERLRLGRRVYYAVNKPSGVVCTHRDPSGRPRVIDLVPTQRERLFTVGRLDLHSEGLILVTNDGELANRLMHPRYGVPKTYRVQVTGEPSPEVLLQLQKGVWSAEGRLKAERIKVLGKYKQSTLLEMVLAEGRNREIRRMLARVGHKVLKLTRLAVGPVGLGKLRPGACRPLAPEEIQALYRASGLKSPFHTKRKSGGKKRH